MIEALVVVLVVVVLVLVAAVARAHALGTNRQMGAPVEPLSLVAGCVRRQVIVTTKDGTAFGGVLYAADPDAIVLREAHALAYGTNSSNVPVQGEALILRADVAYIQLP